MGIVMEALDTDLVRMAKFTEMRASRFQTGRMTR